MGLQVRNNRGSQTRAQALRSGIRAFHCDTRSRRIRAALRSGTRHRSDVRSPNTSRRVHRSRTGARQSDSCTIGSAASCRPRGESCARRTARARTTLTSPTAPSCGRRPVECPGPSPSFPPRTRRCVRAALPPGWARLTVASHRAAPSSPPPPPMQYLDPDNAIEVDEAATAAPASAPAPAPAPAAVATTAAAVEELPAVTDKPPVTVEAAAAAPGGHDELHSPSHGATLAAALAAASAFPSAASTPAASLAWRAMAALVSELQPPCRPHPLPLHLYLHPSLCAYAAPGTVGSDGPSDPELAGGASRRSRGYSMEADGGSRAPASGPWPRGALLQLPTWQHAWKPHATASAGACIFAWGRGGGGGLLNDGSEGCDTNQRRAVRCDFQSTAGGRAVVRRTACAVSRIPPNAAPSGRRPVAHRVSTSVRRGDGRRGAVLGSRIQRGAGVGGAAPRRDVCGSDR
jgi:hypothetical protein